jgi:hypothetical protein
MHDFLRWILIATQAASMAALVRSLRLYPFFLCYLGLSVWQLAWNSPLSPGFWEERWMPLESAIIVLHAAVAGEAFLWATARRSDRLPLALSLTGMAVSASIVVVFALPEPESFLDGFIQSRELIHSGLFAFLGMGSIFIILWRQPIERYAAYHGLLLTAWTGLLAFTGPLAGSHWWTTNLIFRSIGCGIYGAWALILVRSRATAGAQSSFASREFFA